MTTKHAAFRFLLAVAALTLKGVRRVVRLLAGPGTGPFLSGV